MNPILFYDGACGLCHGAVRFVVKRDTTGLFRFAPLQGETLQRLVSAEVRAVLPDSLVLRQEDGTLLIRSSAVIAMLKRLPGPWPAMGFLLGILPRFLRDFGYDGVAKVRHRLFKKPGGACPLVPPELRDRFLP